MLQVSPQVLMFILMFTVLVINSSIAESKWFNKMIILQILNIVICTWGADRSPTCLMLECFPFLSKIGVFLNIFGDQSMATEWQASSFHRSEAEITVLSHSVWGPEGRIPSPVREGETREVRMCNESGGGEGRGGWKESDWEMEKKRQMWLYSYEMDYEVQRRKIIVWSILFKSQINFKPST